MLPQTGVTFSCDDAALQKLFDEAERKCLHNLKDFGADTVLVERRVREDLAGNAADGR